MTLRPAFALAGCVGLGLPITGAAFADTNALLAQAYLSCLHGNGNGERTVEAFAATGWLPAGPAEDGLIYFTRPEADAPYVYAGAEGTFCHVETPTLGTDAARKLLDETLAADGAKVTDAGFSVDDCPQQNLPGWGFVTVTSGGQDPTCSSRTDSAVRFEYDSIE